MDAGDGSKTIEVNRLAVVMLRVCRFPVGIAVLVGNGLRVARGWGLVCLGLGTLDTGTESGDGGPDGRGGELGILSIMARAPPYILAEPQCPHEPMGGPGFG